LKPKNSDDLMPYPDIIMEAYEKLNEAQKTAGSSFGQSLRARLNIKEGPPETGQTAGSSFGQSLRARINIIEGLPGTGKTAGSSFGQSLRARINIIEGHPGTDKTAGSSFGQSLPKYHRRTSWNRQNCDHTGFNCQSIGE
jgi:hypothetical protein